MLHIAYKERWLNGSNITVTMTSRASEPAVLVSTLKVTGKLAGTPSGFKPSPETVTLLASGVAGSTLTVNGLQ